MRLIPALRTARKATAVGLMLTGGFTIICLIGLYGLSGPISALSIFHVPSLPSLLLRGLRYLFTHPRDELAWVFAISLLSPILVFIAGVAFYPWPDFRDPSRRMLALLKPWTAAKEAEAVWPPPPAGVPPGLPPSGGQECPDQSLE